MLKSRVKKSKLLEPLLATEIKIGQNRPGVSYSYSVNRHLFLLMVVRALESDPAVPGLDGSAGDHRTHTMHQQLQGGGGLESVQNVYVGGLWGGTTAGPL